MGLFIKKTGCTLGPSTNCRTQFAGDEEVPACDVTLHSIMLEKEAFNELMEDDQAHAHFYVGKGGIYEPRFKKLGPLSLPTKFEKCTVSFWFEGEDESLQLKTCKIKGIELDRQTGGLTTLKCQVQCLASGDQVALLYIHQNKDASCSIRFGKEAAKKQKEQPELPLDHGADGDGKGEEDEGTVH